MVGPLIGNFVFGKLINEVKFRMNKECVPYNRRMEYVNRTLYLADYAKEFRMSEVFRVLGRIYEEGFQGVLGKMKEYRSRKVFLVFMRNIFTFVVIFQGVIFYSLYRVMVTHSMSISGFTVLFSAMNAVAWMVIQSSKSIIKSYEDSLYIANLREFLEYEPLLDERQKGVMPKTCEDAAESDRVLEFRRVSFTYLGQDKPVLQDIDMTIHRKEKIAIVGHNGAGKTTFVKLLMRLYDVSEGEILYFGRNVRELDLPEYRKLYGTAFQDYQVFAMTVAENVLMRRPEGEADYRKAEDCLRRAGVYEKVSGLPHGMDTILTKEFAEDGAVLSGGELQKIAVARAFAKEYQIAIFDEPSSALDPVAEQLKQEFSETNRKVYPVVERYGKKNVVAGLVGDFFSNDILMNTMYLGYLVYQTVVRKVFSYGSTMALFNASASLKNSLRNVALMLPKFEQHGLYVEKIRTFQAFESSMECGEARLDEKEFEELSVENVSFAYGKDANTLHDISLSVRAGEKIAIVGYNGAGKSTLIKLLLRLYDVGQGRVLLNGRDIREYDKENYRSLFATVFQDYKIFAAAIADNVKMDVACETDRKEIKRALEKSGFADRLASLPKGMDTPLTREFEEGVNLSGGEAQKVAIARTFYKYCPVIILDEPSSALDPVSEYQLNQAMLDVARDKTVIFISHRLSSTVMADRIYMLEQGRVIEEGSHKELMEREGKYAQMFRMQAEKYSM